MLTRFLFAAMAALAFASPALAQPKTDYTRTEDVIYARKFGLAMTMDIFAPKDQEKANGKGIIFCVSGGWVSAKVIQTLCRLRRPTSSWPPSVKSSG